MTAFFFADDNIAIDKEYARNLFKAMIPLNVRWGSQVSIHLAQDTELLRLAYQSGCRSVYIGFESIYQKSLDEVHKNINVEKYEDLIKNIHDQGIAIDASIIFGFEDEDRNAIQKTIDYLIENEIELAQFSSLTPYPGTTFYDKLKQNDLIDLQKYNWTYYDQFHRVYDTQTWQVEDLNSALIDAYKKFYSLKSINYRMRKLRKRMNWPYVLFLTYMNWQFRRFSKYIKL